MRTEESIINILFDTKPEYGRVVCLTHTTQHEKDFDTVYHEKYIGKVGCIVDHPVLKGSAFEDFVCLKFSKYDANWFHKDDLEWVLDGDAIFSGREEEICLQQK